MSCKVEGILDIESMIIRMSVAKPRNVMASLNKNAYLVAEMAKKMAPVDKGNLEESIMVSPAAQGRDSAGRFGISTADVYLDLEHAARNGTTVGRYAYIMHEHLTPAGSMQLGKESEDKQGRVGVQVGGWFLYRALKHYADIIYRDALAASHLEDY